ncbi:MAG: hypothetical protein ACYDHH_21860 [Solirubrobacteraceae bacterium]
MGEHFYTTVPDFQAASDRLIELTYELLDAHCDTICLAENSSGTPGWAAHVAYLKDLQRVGQRTLAEVAGFEPKPA